VHDDPVVAAAAAAEDGDALPPQHQHLAGLRPRPELELVAAVQRLDRHGRPDRGARERHVEHGDDVVALALEALVRRHRDVDVEVAAGGAGLAGVAAARHAQALAGHDARRDLHLDRLVRTAAAAAATGGAGRVDLDPTAAAGG